jgi:hypothetical protein
LKGNTIMKRAIGLIAATLLTTSVYSQDYNSSSQNSDSTPPDYQSRQSEAGAPASSDSSSTSSSGYEVSPGTSGGNSLTGQSSGANVQGGQGEDKSLTTRDSDVSGSEYRGTAESDSTSSEPLKGSGTADGAFHEPAAPVREGSQSEGWSGAGTFSGAGPGSVSGSTSSPANNIDVDVSSDSSSYSSSPSTVENSTSFNAEVSGNAALENRDQDLRERGLEPDSRALTREETFDRIDRDINDDGVVIFEDWTIVEPDTNVGGPAGSDSGSSSSSDADNRVHSDSSARGSIGANSSDSSSSYNDELYQRVQRDWSARTGNTDVPATPGVMDHEMDNLRLYNSRTAESLDSGAPASSESGKSSGHEKECDVNKGSSAEFEQGELDNSVSSDYHINRGEDESYHINRSESESLESSSAPGEYGDRATSENYDDGHLNGNNAAGNSATSESGSDSSDSNASSSEEGALNQPDL